MRPPVSGTLTGPIPLRSLDPFGLCYPATDVPSSASWLDSGVTESSKEKWSNPQPPVHRAIARWAAMCAEHALTVFEQRRPGDRRPRAAIESLRAWERDEIPMSACRTAAFAAHAAARDATEAGAPDAVAAARAAGQAAAVAHMFDHAPYAASYAAKAIGFHLTGEADRKAERTWQWENLDPELRTIGFPRGL